MTHVIDAKVIQRLRNFDLLLGIKEGVGKLLALSQCTLNDFEAGDIAQEIRDAGVVAVGIPGGWARVLSALDGREAFMLRRIWYGHGSAYEVKEEDCKITVPLTTWPLMPLVWPLAVWLASEDMMSDVGGALRSPTMRWPVPKSRRKSKSG